MSRGHPGGGVLESVSPLRLVLWKDTCPSYLLLLWYQILASAPEHDFCHNLCCLAPTSLALPNPACSGTSWLACPQLGSASAWRAGRISSLPAYPSTELLWSPEFFQGHRPCLVTFRRIRGNRARTRGHCHHKAFVERRHGKSNKRMMKSEDTGVRALLLVGTQCRHKAGSLRGHTFPLHHLARLKPESPLLKAR